jgi:hypothetical protein
MPLSPFPPPWSLVVHWLKVLHLNDFVQVSFKFSKWGVMTLVCVHQSLHIISSNDKGDWGFKVFTSYCYLTTMMC